MSIYIYIIYSIYIYILCSIYVYIYIYIYIYVYIYMLYVVYIFLLFDLYTHTHAQYMHTSLPVSAVRPILPPRHNPDSAEISVKLS